MPGSDDYDYYYKMMKSQYLAMYVPCKGFVVIVGDHNICLYIGKYENNVMLFLDVTS